MTSTIPFNKVYLTGDEEKFIKIALTNGKVGAGGQFTDLCIQFFEERYQFKKCFLTTSCTSALEMSSLLMNIQVGDEVILPAYTFVSTANAFLLRGAKLVFADSQENHPNIDADKIEALITSKTKAIVIVHYAGDACDMKKILEICSKHKLFLVEDAAQCIDSYYKHEDGRLQALGSFGDFAAISFHESKNIISGEGGLLIINNPDFIDRAEIVYEKGTNRAKFIRDEINKYEWVDIGSSYALSELNAAFLWAQLSHLDEIQEKRISSWKYYENSFSKKLPLGVKFLNPSKYSVGNAHIFFLLCENINKRNEILNKLSNNHIQATFHFSSLCKSLYFNNLNMFDKVAFKNSEKYSDGLIRLPLFNDITDVEQYKIIDILCDL